MKTKLLYKYFLKIAFMGMMASIVIPMAFSGGRTLNTENLPAYVEEIPDCMIFTSIEVDTMPTRANPSDFIIFTWGEIPNTVRTNSWGDFANMDSVMSDLYACGFNTSMFIPAMNLSDIKLARKNNLTVLLQRNYIPVDTNTQVFADNKFEQYMKAITDPDDRKAVYAVLLIDEPKTTHFPLLKIWCNAIKKQHVLPYINLFSDHINPDTVKAKDYNEYLDKFIEYCEPSILSYDYYAFKEGGIFLEDQFYSSIETIRKKALDNDIPFWNTILSKAHFFYDEPTDAMMALQVYSTLAYGGKGIGHFSYYTGQIGNYRLGAIDRFGHRTQTWKIIRNINLQIHSLVPFYSKLKSVNVFHTGQPPKNCQGFDSSVLLESISGDHLLVGEFKDTTSGKPSVIVVNKSLSSSIAFDIKFKEYATDRILLINPYNRDRIPFEGEQKWLAPGYGVLLTVE